jgi:hypothetical protein
MRYRLMPAARRQKLAVLAILASAGGILLSLLGHWGWGLLLATLAIPASLAAVVRSASPVLSGGRMALLALILAIVGLFLALMVMLVNLVTLAAR